MGYKYTTFDPKPKLSSLRGPNCLSAVLTKLSPSHPSRVMPPPPLVQQFPDTTPLINHHNYPFDAVNQVDNDREFFEIVRRFLVDQHYDFENIIVPLDFTKYTIPQLKLSYGTLPEEPFRPLYFLHHFTGHPYKRNQDMSQKTTTDGVQRCYWKKFDREYGKFPLNGLPGGNRKKYRLSMAMNIGNEADHWDRFYLMEYELEPWLYQMLGQLPLNHERTSHWSVKKLFFV